MYRYRDELENQLIALEETEREARDAGDNELLYCVRLDLIAVNSEIKALNRCERLIAKDSG
jgi:hypothetical protein